jgi:CRP/FNR family transcriptional regulator, cyclic AMP receptor protein
MENSPILSRLQNLTFTQGLEPGHLERLAELTTPMQWGAGEVVFREGEIGSLLYVVEQGRVAIEVTVPGRGQVTILTVGPGEVFGWSSLFFQRPKTASARTTIPTRAMALNAGLLRELCEAEPRLGYALTKRLLRVVSERLKATRLQLLDVFGAGS